MKRAQFRSLAAGSMLVILLGVLAACSPGATSGGFVPRPSGPPLKIGVVLAVTVMAGAELSMMKAGTGMFALEVPKVRGLSPQA